MMNVICIMTRTNECECDGVVDRKFKFLNPVAPRLTGVEELDDEIFLRTDFVTALLTGAHPHVVKKLYEKESFWEKIHQIKYFNDKCLHTSSERKGKWVIDSMDDESEECECVNGTCGQCFFQECCEKNKDVRVLTDQQKYTLLRYLYEQGVQICGTDLSFDENFPFDKILYEAFEFCECQIIKLRSTITYPFARNYNILRILSGLGGLGGLRYAEL